MILVTGSLWMKQGHRSIGVVSHELAMEAQNEALMTLYTPGSTAETAKDLVETLVKKTVAVTVVINEWHKQPQNLKEALIDLKNRYPTHLRIYNFRASTREHFILHAKAFVIDRKKAVIGSSNLSWSGMHNNYEIAVLLEGKDAEKVAQLLCALVNSPLCREIRVSGKKQ